MFSLTEFTLRDGISEADRARYSQLVASFESDLRPSRLSVIRKYR